MEAARAGLGQWVSDGGLATPTNTICPIADLDTLLWAIAQTGLASNLTGWAIEATVTDHDQALPDQVVTVSCVADADGTQTVPGEIPIGGASVVVIDLADAMSIQDFEAMTSTKVSSSAGEVERFVNCRIQPDPDRDSVSCRELMDLGGIIVGVQLSGLEGNITPGSVSAVLNEIAPDALSHLATE